MKYESSEKYIMRELQSELAVRDGIASALEERGEGSIIGNFVTRVNDMYENGNVEDDEEFQYQYGGGGHNGFDNSWHTGYTKAEIEYAEFKAKNDAGSDENVIDNNHKWLYYNKNGRTYFALYSISDLKSPTILYASKNNRAVNDREFLDVFIKSLKKRDDNGRKSGTADGLLHSIRSDTNGTYVSNGTSLLSSGSTGYDKLYSRYRGKRISQAYVNCLENIRKVPGGGRFISDGEYMSAVKSGDMQLVEEMIIDAAKYAGYNSPKLYHGTGSAVFTVFSSVTETPRIPALTLLKQPERKTAAR